MNKQLFVWEELKSSFWFIPVLIITAAIGVAIGAVYVDQLLEIKPAGVIRYILSGSSDSARSVLSVISSAMIGVAGTVFSITLVALTLASSQYGPRLLRNFMHERLNQVVLGTYVSTYIYCLIVLNAIKDNADFEFVPVFSVLLALLATIGNIILLIIFIHHISMSIQADKVISDISINLSKNIKTLFPEVAEEEIRPEVQYPNLPLLKMNYVHQQAVLAPRSGYLQLTDHDGILDFAKDKKILVILPYRPGKYLVKGVNLIEIYTQEKISEKEMEKLQEAFIIGEVRTPQQDAEYSFHQIVEIAVRALSPGINDPYTAIACVDNLRATLCELTSVQFPAPYQYDEDGQLRVLRDTLTFEGMMDTAFNQIRQFAQGIPAVAIRQMEALQTIDTFAKVDAHKAAIRKHAKMILRMAEKSFDEENDLNDLKKRSGTLI